jgi:hypothetical protein
MNRANSSLMSACILTFGSGRYHTPMPTCSAHIAYIEAPPPSYLGRITPRRIMGDTTWSEIWKSQSVGSFLALNSSSNPPI